MTRDQFRALVLSYPEVEEAEEADGTLLFTVAGRPFARIRANAPKFMDVMLKRSDSEAAGAGEPELFVPLPGTWRRPGYLQIATKAADSTFASALNAAWLNAAPRKLARQHIKRR